MKVCSVIVTYGDRFYLLKQVIGACYSEGVDKVIVVDNASEKNSRDKLKKFEKEHKDRVKVVYLDENTGSAGGYKRGLEEAYQCKECEYIWLLDDDNQPQKDSLKVLKEFWNGIKDENKEEKVALLSYRPDRVTYKEAIMTNDPNLVLGRKNSFLGFHILDLPRKVIRIMKRKMCIKTFIEDKDIKSGKVAVAPYGGMFFHRNLVKSIGYPKEEFFVYADDHEWSYRITKNDGSIYFILDSLVEDIDISLGLRGKKTSFFYSLLNKGEDVRVYYSIRNRIIFEKDLIENNLFYKLNNLFFKGILTILKNKNNKIRYQTIIKAIKDGYDGR